MVPEWVVIWRFSSQLNTQLLWIKILLNLEEKWVVFGGVFSLLDVLGITTGFFDGSIFVLAPVNTRFLGDFFDT